MRLRDARALQPAQPVSTRPWAEETVYHAGEEFFGDLLDAISKARKSIELETYIYDRDRLGNRVAQALSSAAGRGVHVRLLIDGVGSAHWSWAHAAPLAANGVQVRFYHPLPWQHQGGFPLWKYLAPKRIALGLSKLNRRNHRKTCVIDGNTAFAGGMNISARHLGPKAWRDTAVRVAGEGVREISDSFRHAWVHSRGALSTWRRRIGPIFQSSWVRTNNDRGERRSEYDGLLQRIIHSRSRVWITTPYFVPDRALFSALRSAAKSGSDVRLLLPYKSDVWGFKWANHAFYLPLLAAGARIYEYEASILHAKTLLIDDWAQVGSSNMNHRSLLHDLEVDIVLGTTESLHEMESRFLADLASSRQVELRTWRHRPWTERAFEQAALTLRHWL
jgi:cardiolipin synthase A/B